ncbi:YqcC family protein [Zhongshania aquimaris]|uniref:YqcC family protein n=1 Tax=Zhongshania aquimaris TaxID=2857107 RepID=A0ABS6VWQ5_9GAMM|nr:YqcC family protein [Zhongshania aquimaris]MBW2942115.1 YqcC family protein [Zhongshania aquimaris]
MSKYHEVAAVLMDIEAELRQIGHWDAEPPPPEALRSEQPFAIDTLNFAQWLQFVFIPRMRFLIEQRQELPRASGIAPMAEEYFRASLLPVGGLMTALQTVDALLGSQGISVSKP